MNKNEFLAQMDLLDPALSGRGQDIAKEASVSYNTYLNYRQGRGNDEKTMLAILDASKKIAAKLRSHLNSINI